MAQFAEGFVTVTSGAVRPEVQRCLDTIEGRMRDEGLTPDWTTLQVVKKDLPTGWPQMPSVTAYGVLLDSAV